MPFYEVEYDYTIRDGGVVTIQGDNVEHAETVAREYVKETFLDVSDVEIITVKEIVNK